MRLDVWLISFHEGSTPAKTLAGTFGIPLRDSMMLEWSLPAVVGRDLGEQDAASAVRMLRGIGAKAEARPMDSAVAIGYALPFDPADAARASSMPSPVIEERRDVPSDRDLARVGDDLPSAPPPRRAASRKPLTSSRKPLITSRKAPPPAPRRPPPAPPRPPPAPRQAPPAPRQAPAISRQADVALPQPPAVSHQPAVDLPQPLAVSRQPALALPQPPAASTRGPQAASPQLPTPGPAPKAPRQPAPASPQPELMLEDEVREPARVSRQPPRDLPEDSLYDTGPPLQLEHVERARPATRRPVHSTRPPEKSGVGIGSMLPALGALAVGAVAVFFTLRRGQTALLGTADIVGHALDGVALASLALALVFGFAAAFSKRGHFNMAPSGVALIMAVGAAFFLNQWRVPTVGPDSELGGDASSLITQSQVTLAGLDETSSRALVDALRDAGAISIRGAAPVGFMGAKAFHALAVELPPGPSSRARIVVAFRAVMARFGGSLSPDPAPDQSVWVVAL